MIRIKAKKNEGQTQAHARTEKPAQWNELFNMIERNY